MHKKENIVESDCFVKAPEQLSPLPQTELLEWQATFTDRYTDIDPDGNYDGNSVVIIDKADIPDYVYSVFSTAIDSCENVILLKNTSNVIPHYDTHRQISLTIPLNITNTPTKFWDEHTENYIELFHFGEAYIQNNSKVHSVDNTNNEFRVFLQLNWYTHSYEYWKDKLVATSIS